MLQELTELIRRREPFTLATAVAASDPSLVGLKALCSKSGAAGDLLPWLDEEQLAAPSASGSDLELTELELPQGRVTLLLEHYYPPARLLVLGGGHISRPLTAIATLLDYETTVIDDRPEFADPERFPGAHVVCGEFPGVLRGQMIDAGSSVVIVTRSHQQDLDCLEYLLPLQPGYLGMIGSRRRVKLIREQLLACGYPEELLSRVCMPIGLPIGAQTPEEIAVSIAAQLVAARRGLENSPLPPTSGGQQWKLLDKLVECLQAGRPVVAATVIRTSGSTPRKAGAKMLVAPDGSLEGTIGGGCAENEARREALALFHRGGCQLSRQTLNADIADAEGMSCGGTMEVFLERMV